MEINRLINYINEGKYKEALKISDKYTSLLKDNPYISYPVGLLYLVLGKYKQAKDIFDSYYKIGAIPNKDEFLVAYAELFDKLGNKTKALELLNEVSTKTPLLYAKMAKLYLRYNEFEKTAQCLQECEIYCAVNEPTGGIVTSYCFNVAARVLDIKNDVKGSEILHTYTYALRSALYGDFHLLTIESLYNLARFYERQKQFKVADKLFTEVITNCNKAYNEHYYSSLATCGIARIHKQKNNFSQASAYFIKAYNKIENAEDSVIKTYIIREVSDFLFKTSLK